MAVASNVAIRFVNPTGTWTTPAEARVMRSATSSDWLVKASTNALVLIPTDTHEVIIPAGMFTVTQLATTTLSEDGATEALKGLLNGRVVALFDSSGDEVTGDGYARPSTGDWSIV